MADVRSGGGVLTLEQAGNNFPIWKSVSGCHWSYSTSALRPGGTRHRAWLPMRAKDTGRVRPVAPRNRRKHREVTLGRFPYRCVPEGDVDFSLDLRGVTADE